MANFTATDTFPNVEVLETTDQVLGGLSTSPSNKQAQALVNRTEWLKKRTPSMEVVNAYIGVGVVDFYVTNINIGKFIILISDTADTVRNFNIVLPSYNIVSGNIITILFSDSDNKLLIGTRGGLKYYSGDLVQFIWNGTDWAPNVIHRSINDTTYGTTSSDLGSGKNVITLPSTNRKWYVNNSLITGRLTNIQLQGSFQPRNGTEISILNISSSVWEITEGESGGNIFLGESGVAYNSNSYKSFFIKDGEYLNLVYNNTSASKWELLENDISVKRVNITGSGGSTLPPSVYPSLKNWIDKLIERIENPEALLFKGDGIGLTGSCSADWTKRVLRFGFNKIYNNSLSYYGFISPDPDPSNVSIPEWRLAEAYTNGIKEINYFRPTASSGDYSIYFKFKVKNLGLATTLGFSLMQGNYTLLNPVGSSLVFQEAVLAAGDEVDIHLYSYNFPYNSIANNSTTSDPPYELYPYIWILVEDASGNASTYEFSNCQVELRSVYL